MYIAMNEFKIVLGKENEFENLWKNRESHLGDVEGFIKFNLLILDQSISVIALGGISEENFRKLKLTNSIGFASISWIKKNGLSKLRPF